MPRTVARSSAAIWRSLLTSLTATCEGNWDRLPSQGSLVDHCARTGDNSINGDDLAGAHEDRVASLIDLDDMWVHFDLREDLVKTLKVGDRFDVRIPALAMQQTDCAGHACSADQTADRR
jgi:hypothetical protein